MNFGSNLHSDGVSFEKQELVVIEPAALFTSAMQPA